jgi:hypothetical protein
MTNFERIKAMSVEEMASYLAVIERSDNCINSRAMDCKDCPFNEICKLHSEKDCVEWLEREVQDG